MSSWDAAMPQGGPWDKVLVTGGVRSGKSTYAERLVRGWARATGATPTYVATGAAPSDADPEWADRVRAHRDRRAAEGGWLCVETGIEAGIEAGALPRALETAGGPVVVDCLGTWLTGVLDRAGAWEAMAEWDVAGGEGDGPGAPWREAMGVEIDGFLAAFAACAQPVVAVTNEVGWGVVPTHRSGRFFADELGRLNRRVAQLSGDVVLVVTGRALHLPPD